MHKIIVKINDEEVMLPAHSNLIMAIQHISLSQSNYAIAVNQVFIPRGDYANTFLQPDDVIDVIIPMQGG